MLAAVDIMCAVIISIFVQFLICPTVHIHTMYTELFEKFAMGIHAVIETSLVVFCCYIVLVFN
jgi:hypothetical protein